MESRLIYAPDPLHPTSKAALSEFGVVEGEADGVTVSSCTVLLSWPRRVRSELLSRMTGLRAIQAMSAGVDGMDFRCIPDAVEVFSNAGAYTPQVSEAAWGLILGLAKGVNVKGRSVTPRIVYGRKMLVLGCGGIGSEVARKAKVAFEMKTVGASRSFKFPEYFDERHPIDDIPMLLKDSDVVVDALPLTLETRSILDYPKLREMKEKAILVNIGRGETIDLASVTRLLKERPETRFGTDVFWKVGGKESFDVPIWDLPNFAGTQHTGGGGGNEQDLERSEAMAAENVARYLRTGEAANRVRKSDYL